MTFKELKAVIAHPKVDLDIFRKEDLSHPIRVKCFDLENTSDFDNYEVSSIERGTTHLTIDLLPPGLRDIFAEVYH